jgi:glycosyltransferase involved in cell wall biosynthesis
MASGAPVASSNATCLPEVYQQAAEYFDPTDVDAMATTIDRIISDKTVRQKLIDAGKHLVSTYSWQSMAEQTLRIYNQVLRTK